jgi:hypothetical protein
MMKKIGIIEFVTINDELINSAFVKKSYQGTFKRKFISLFYLMKLFIFRVYVTIFMIFAEPLLVVSQLQLRRNGGLAGSYQFHRLYEIRSILKNGTLSTGIEFGSGASSILFAKYLHGFISIEESYQWRESYLANLSILQFMRPELFCKIKDSIIVLERTEYLDSANHLVCSYRLPACVINEKYDLAYVDGPTAWVQSELQVVGKVADPFGYLPNVSVLELEYLPTCIMVDGRRGTLVHLLRSLESKKYDFLLKGSYLEKPRVNPYHSTFTFVSQLSG